MKILITTDWYVPVINGVVTSVINLETELRRMGHDVRILTLSRDRSSHHIGDVYYIQSFNIDKIYPNARGTYHYYDKFVNEIIEWKPDVVHSQCELISFPFAKKVARKCMAPLIHTYHTIYEDYTHYFSFDKTIGRKAVEICSKRLLMKVDSVVVPSDKIRELLSLYGVTNPIYTIPTGIRLDTFGQKISSEERIRYKTELGILPGNKVLISLGRVAKEKNILEIVNYVKRMRGDITLLIVGDGPYLRELQELVKSSSMEKRVVFTGMIEPEEVYKYYQLGDVFVCASNSETQGLTYIEALASGLPAVCRKDLCLKEVIYNDENGFLYENYIEFESAIEGVLKSEESYQRMSEKAIEVSQKFSTHTFAETMEELYLSEIYKRKFLDTFCSANVSNVASVFKRRGSV